MRKFSNKYANFIYKYTLITAGLFIYSAAIALFLDPNRLAPGGVTGLAIIMNSLVGLETGTWIFILNIPIMILCIVKFGIKMALSSVYSIVVQTVLTNCLALHGGITADTVLATVTGAVLMALGLGTVLRAGSTTGGVDIIVKVIKSKFPHMRTGKIFLMMDITVVTLSAFVYKDVERAIYAGFVVFIVSFVLDIVLYGRDGAKLIYIISDKSERITERLLEELEVGVTGLNAYGAYSGKPKKAIMCVMRKPLSIKAQDIVKEEDPEAFMIITNATEIFGEGYKSYFGEQL